MELTGQSSFVDRVIGAARLDERIYEEVEHDRGATGQAAAVVLLSSLAAGVSGLAVVGPVGLVLFTIAGLISWAIYAYVTYYIGTRLLAGPDTSADWGELARTLGFAQTPGLIVIVGVVEALAVVVSLVAGIWIIVTTVVALRAALDFTIGRAIGTALIGWLVLVVIRGVIFAILSA